MNFMDLQYIQVIARERSITKAAQKLIIAQPSLSQRVQKIEAEPVSYKHLDVYKRQVVGEGFHSAVGVGGGHHTA